MRGGGDRAAGQRRPALLLLKAPSACHADEEGQEGPWGCPGGGRALSQREMVGPGPGRGGEKGSESQNGDVFWNQSQQDLLMDWTWGMSEGESCHARLQVSGLSTWVDGGAFSPKPRDDWGRSRDWGENIKISLQKPEVLQEGVKLCRAEVVGEGPCIS